jgi:hypothetical protein
MALFFLYQQHDMKSNDGRFKNEGCFYRRGDANNASDPRKFSE